MKNVVTKYMYYKDIDFFNHIYFLDVDYDFNEKTIDDIIKFVTDEPFFDVLIHANDITHDIVTVIKEVSKVKNVWFESSEMLFETFATMQEDTRRVIGFDKVQVMIDALGDVIDVKKSIEEESLVKFNYMELPF